MKNTAKWICVLVVTLCVTAPMVETATALGVSPGAFCAQGVPVGEKTDTGISLAITNDTDKERIFSVKVDELPPFKNVDLHGYTSMPQLKWFVLTGTELTTPAKGSASSRISVIVPEDERYYNQHWGVSCLIEYTGQKGLFQEAVKTVYLFETKSKADIKGRPAGDLGVAPSIVSIDLADNKTLKGAFRIYNNTKEPRQYKLASRLPEAKAEGLSLSNSPGFTWLSDAGQVKLDKTSIKVEAGGTAEVSVLQAVPDSQLTEGCMLEGLVFIESDKGQANFVRVHIERTPAAKAETPKSESKK